MDITLLNLNPCHPSLLFCITGTRSRSVFPARRPLHLEHVHGELLRDLAEAVVAGHAEVGGALPPRRHRLVDVAVEAPLVHQVTGFAQDVSVKYEGGPAKSSQGDILQLGGF